MSEPAPPDTQPAHDELLEGDETVATRVELASDEPAGVGEVRPFSLRTFATVGSAMLVLTGLVAATYVVPGLQGARPFREGDPVPFWNVLGRPFETANVEAAVASSDPAQLAREEALRRARLDDDDDAEDDETVADGSPTSPTQGRAGTGTPSVATGALAPHPDDALPVLVPLENAEALAPFFRALARVERGEPQARAVAVHWGDSALGLDGITSAIRRKLQRRFGDAGHGFHLLSPSNPSYRHQGIAFETNGSWSSCFIIELCRKDGHYGLGGGSFSSAGGAQSRYRTAKKGSIGRTVSRFEVYYAAMPGGGKLQLKVDGGAPKVIETRAEALEDRVEVLEVEDGEHDLEVRAIGGGKVRAYGVVLGRDRGVAWDELSLIGAFTTRLLGLDPDHLRRQLAFRGASLAVFMFGGNDMQRTMSMEDYKEEYGRVLRLVRGAGDAWPMACLVMAPVDHGLRRGSRIESLPIVSRMVAAQREQALAEGCAFWNTFEAMGGEGSAGRWFRSDPRMMSGDLAHLTHVGHKVIGEQLYLALMQAYLARRSTLGNGPG